MPTGYTANIKDGITFEQYALSCAKAFGACITIRDENGDIPEEFLPSEYHKNELEKTKEKECKLWMMTEEEIKDKIIKSHEENLKRYKERLIENTQLIRSYRAMLVKVKKWNPPTDAHQNLKKFMISQIEKSIDFDDNSKSISIPTKPTMEEWIENEMKSLNFSLDYHQKNWDDEVARVQGRNKWIKDLRNSLK